MLDHPLLIGRIVEVVIHNLRLGATAIHRSLVVRLLLHLADGVGPVEHECCLLESVPFRLGHEKVDEATDADDDTVEHDVVLPADGEKGDRVDVLVENYH